MNIVKFLSKFSLLTNPRVDSNRLFCQWCVNVLIDKNQLFQSRNIRRYIFIEFFLGNILWKNVFSYMNGVINFFRVTKVSLGYFYFISNHLSFTWLSRDLLKSSIQYFFRSILFLHSHYEKICHFNRRASSKMSKLYDFHWKILSKSSECYYPSEFSFK